jgi:hypothetical protein
LSNLKRNNDGREKLGGYTVGMAPDDRDKVVVDVSEEDVLEFVKPNMFERRNAQNKRPVKNRLLRNYTT